MSRPAPEPVAVVKKRRDTALSTLVAGVPYAAFLGIRFDRRGDELTAVMPYDEILVGAPLLPALHGGATAAFLETAALIELGWSLLWPKVEGGEIAEDAGLPGMPRTITVTTDYLRPGLPRDSYARARIVRSGRRYASVHVSAWQDHRDKPHAQATVHFVMPDAAD